MSSVSTVGPYRLGERVGTSVWKATDSRNEKPVALKILTKQLPKEPAKRDALVREVRVAAALYHAFLIPILEIVPIGDNLLLVMDFVDGLAFSKRLAGKPASRAEFFRVAYQVTDAVRFVHSKSLVHGNINADSVLVTAAGQVKLAGFNLINLLPRPDGISAHYQQKANDARSVAYMAPEQITGQRIDPKTDVYSLGVVMYELATGRLPFQAKTGPDFARAIVEGNPISPKSINPAIETSVLTILGRCLFKEQFSRLKDAKAVLDEISKADPEAAASAAQMAARATAPAVVSEDDTEVRQSVLLIADVANYEELAAKDSEAAAKAISQMQQVLGEAVYLFDGKVADPFAKRLVAELPSVENALEAARKGEFDFSEEQQGSDAIPVRLLLHIGTLTTRGGEVTGEAVSKGGALLSHIPPMQVYMTDDFVRKARGLVRVRDAGARGGMKLYTIVPAEKPAPPPADIEEAVVSESEVDEVEGDSPQTSKRRPLVLAAVAGGILIVAAIAAFVFSRGRETEPATTASPRAAPTPAVSESRKVRVGEITVDGSVADPEVAARVNIIRTAASEILRTVPGVRLADAPAPDVTEFSGVVRAGAAGPELVPAPSDPQSPGVPLADAASGIRGVLDWISQRARVPLRNVSSSPDALNAFALAVTATAAEDVAKAEPAIRASIAADPNFMAAQMLAMRFFAARGQTAEAVTAAQRVVALEPENLEASRNLARLALRLGAVTPAFQAYDAILKKNGNDAEALTQVARYAASVGDAPRFTAALTRLNATPQNMVQVHAPDILVASGQMEVAISKYYDIEVNVPNNPALALKIGRISALRRAMPIVELELKKLEQHDPAYGYHVLKAYMAASRGVSGREEAENELEAASRASVPGDDFWTSAAEVYAMLGGTEDVISALERALGRKEPTASYVLTNPLFSYLRSEPRFAAVRSAFGAQQHEIRSALAQINI